MQLIMQTKHEAELLLNQDVVMWLAPLGKWSKAGKAISFMVRVGTKEEVEDKLG